MKTPIHPALKLLFALASIALAGGCANGFAKFYSPNPRLAEAQRFMLPYSGHTSIFTSSDMKGDAEKLARQGYTLLGYSSFHGTGRVTRAQLEDQAKTVGADIVLSASAYQGTRQIVVPMASYTPGTVSTTTSTGTVNANAYGSGGYAFGTANYNGMSTTTTPGTVSTQMVPMTVDSYSYDATFWRKAVPPTLGVQGQPLPDDLRQSLQRNAGMVVTLVNDGSPAFRANILVGDVIIAFNDDQVESPQQEQELLDKYSGQKVEVTFIRKGETRKVTVQFNQRPPKQ